MLVMAHKQRHIHKPHMFRDRTQPLDYMTDDELISRTPKTRIVKTYRKRSPSQHASFLSFIKPMSYAVNTNQLTCHVVVVRRTTWEIYCI